MQRCRVPHGWNTASRSGIVVMLQAITPRCFGLPRQYRQTRRFQLMCAVLSMFLIALMDQLNVYAYLAATSFSKFNYPLEIDLKAVVSRLERGETVSYSQINPHPYELHYSPLCPHQLHLLVVVKSSVPYFRNRHAVRQTYGRVVEYQMLAVKVVFLLGATKDAEVQRQVDTEQQRHSDIIQADFVDAYFNNTIKAVAGFRWVHLHCSHAKYILFVDDDYFVNIGNVLTTVAKAPRPLFRGWAFFYSIPKRQKWSVWYTSLEQYPYFFYPPYITAGAYIVDSKTNSKFYLASPYVKYWGMDDVYLGIVSKKLGITPQHDANFALWPKSYSPHTFRDVAAIHGFRDPNKLMEVYHRHGLG